MLDSLYGGKSLSENRALRRKTHDQLQKPNSSEGYRQFHPVNIVSENDYSGPDPPIVETPSFDQGNQETRSLIKSQLHDLQSYVDEVSRALHTSTAESSSVTWDTSDYYASRPLSRATFTSSDPHSRAFTPHTPVFAEGPIQDAWPPQAGAEEKSVDAHWSLPPVASPARRLSTPSGVHWRSRAATAETGFLESIHDRGGRKRNREVEKLRRRKNVASISVALEELNYPPRPFSTPVGVRQSIGVPTSGRTTVLKGADGLTNSWSLGLHRLDDDPDAVDDERMLDQYLYHHKKSTRADDAVVLIQSLWRRAKARTRYKASLQNFRREMSDELCKMFLAWSQVAKAQASYKRRVCLFVFRNLREYTQLMSTFCNLAATMCSRLVVETRMSPDAIYRVFADLRNEDSSHSVMSALVVVGVRQRRTRYLLRDVLAHWRSITGQKTKGRGMANSEWRARDLARCRVAFQLWARFATFKAGIRKKKMFPSKLESTPEWEELKAKFERKRYYRIQVDAHARIANMTKGWRGWMEVMEMRRERESGWAHASRFLISRTVDRVFTEWRNAVLNRKASDYFFGLCFRRWFRLAKQNAALRACGRRLVARSKHYLVMALFERWRKHTFYRVMMESAATEALMQHRRLGEWALSLWRGVREMTILHKILRDWRHFVKRRRAFCRFLTHYRRVRHEEILRACFETWKRRNEKDNPNLSLALEGTSMGAREAADRFIALLLDFTSGSSLSKFETPHDRSEAERLFEDVWAPAEDADVEIDWRRMICYTEFNAVTWTQEFRDKRLFRIITHALMRLSHVRAAQIAVEDTRTDLGDESNSVSTVATVARGGGDAPGTPTGSTAGGAAGSRRRNPLLSKLTDAETSLSEIGEEEGDEEDELMEKMLMLRNKVVKSLRDQGVLEKDKMAKFRAHVGGLQTRCSEAFVEMSIRLDRYRLRFHSAEAKRHSVRLNLINPRFTVDTKDDAFDYNPYLDEWDMYDSSEDDMYYQNKQKMEQAAESNMAGLRMTASISEEKAEDIPIVPSVDPELDRRDEVYARFGREEFDPWTKVEMVTEKKKKKRKKRSTKAKSGAVSATATGRMSSLSKRKTDPEKKESTDKKDKGGIEPQATAAGDKVKRRSTVQEDTSGADKQVQEASAKNNASEVKPTVDQNTEPAQGATDISSVDSVSKKAKKRRTTTKIKKPSPSKAVDRKASKTIVSSKPPKGEAPNVQPSESEVLNTGSDEEAHNVPTSGKEDKSSDENLSNDESDMENMDHGNSTAKKWSVTELDGEPPVVSDEDAPLSDSGEGSDDSATGHGKPRRKQRPSVDLETICETDENNDVSDDDVASKHNVELSLETVGEGPTGTDESGSSADDDKKVKSKAKTKKRLKKRKKKKKEEGDVVASEGPQATNNTTDGDTDAGVQVKETTSTAPDEKISGEHVIDQGALDQLLAEQSANDLDDWSAAISKEEYWRMTPEERMDYRNRRVTMAEKGSDKANAKDFSEKKPIGDEGAGEEGEDVVALTEEEQKALAREERKRKRREERKARKAQQKVTMFSTATVDEVLSESESTASSDLDIFARADRRRRERMERRELRQKQIEDKHKFKADQQDEFLEKEKEKEEKARIAREKSRREKNQAKQKEKDRKKHEKRVQGLPSDSSLYSEFGGFSDETLSPEPFVEPPVTGSSDDDAASTASSEDRRFEWRDHYLQASNLVFSLEAEESVDTSGLVKIPQPETFVNPDKVILARPNVNVSAAALVFADTLQCAVDDEVFVTKEREEQQRKAAEEAERLKNEMAEKKRRKQLLEGLISSEDHEAAAALLQKEKDLERAEEERKQNEKRRQEESRKKKLPYLLPNIPVPGGPSVGKASVDGVMKRGNWNRQTATTSKLDADSRSSTNLRDKYLTNAKPLPARRRYRVAEGGRKYIQTIDKHGLVVGEKLDDAESDDDDKVEAKLLESCLAARESREKRELEFSEPRASTASTLGDEAAGLRDDAMRKVQSAVAHAEHEAAVMEDSSTPDGSPLPDLATSPRSDVTSVITSRPDALSTRNGSLASSTDPAVTSMNAASAVGNRHVRHRGAKKASQGRSAKDVPTDDDESSLGEWDLSPKPKRRGSTRERDADSQSKRSSLMTGSSKTVSPKGCDTKDSLTADGVASSLSSRSDGSDSSDCSSNAYTADLAKKAVKLQHTRSEEDLGDPADKKRSRQSSIATSKSESQSIPRSLPTVGEITVKSIVGRKAFDGWEPPEIPISLYDPQHLLAATQVEGDPGQSFSEFLHPENSGMDAFSETPTEDRSGIRRGREMSREEMLARHPMYRGGPTGRIYRAHTTTPSSGMRRDEIGKPEAQGRSKSPFRKHAISINDSGVDSADDEKKVNKVEERSRALLKRLSRVKRLRQQDLESRKLLDRNHWLAIHMHREVMRQHGLNTFLNPVLVPGSDAASVTEDSVSEHPISAWERPLSTSSAAITDDLSERERRADSRLSRAFDLIAPSPGLKAGTSGIVPQASYGSILDKPTDDTSLDISTEELQKIRALASRTTSSHVRRRSLHEYETESLAAQATLHPRDSPEPVNVTAPSVLQNIDTETSSKDVVSRTSSPLSPLPRRRDGFFDDEVSPWLEGDTLDLTVGKQNKPSPARKRKKSQSVRLHRKKAQSHHGPLRASSPTAASLKAGVGGQTLKIFARPGSPDNAMAEAPLFGKIHDIQASLGPTPTHSTAVSEQDIAALKSTDSVPAKEQNTQETVSAQTSSASGLFMEDGDAGGWVDLDTLSPSLSSGAMWPPTLPTDGGGITVKSGGRTLTPDLRGSQHSSELSSRNTTPSDRYIAGIPDAQTPVRTSHLAYHTVEGYDPHSYNLSQSATGSGAVSQTSPSPSPSTTPFPRRRMVPPKRPLSKPPPVRERLNPPNVLEEDSAEIIGMIPAGEFARLKGPNQSLSLALVGAPLSKESTSVPTVPVPVGSAFYVASGIRQAGHLQGGAVHIGTNRTQSAKRSSFSNKHLRKADPVLQLAGAGYQVPDEYYVDLSMMEAQEKCMSVEKE
eukprot:Rmarinus@m.16354